MIPATNDDKKSTDPGKGKGKGGTYSKSSKSSGKGKGGKGKGDKNGSKSSKSGCRTRAPRKYLLPILYLSVTRMISRFMLLSHLNSPVSTA